MTTFYDDMRDWEDDAPSWCDGEYWPGSTPDEQQVAEPEIVEVVC